MVATFGTHSYDVTFQTLATANRVLACFRLLAATKGVVSTEHRLDMFLRRVQRLTSLSKRDRSQRAFVRRSIRTLYRNR